MSGLNAAKMPIGTTCGPCRVEHHQFIHPRALPIGNLWREDDGCPCCYSHMDPDNPDALFPHLPPMGYGHNAEQDWLDALLRLVPLTALAPEVRDAVEATRHGDWSLARRIMAQAEISDPLPPVPGSSDRTEG